MKRLHAARGKDDRFEVVIPWIEEYTAFTAPGRYIFIARSLFQLCDSDDMVAMLTAHEMSHHDLGHLDGFPDWLGRATNLEIQVLIMALYRVVETRIHGPEKEAEADRNGLELCLKAGYDGQKCVELFDKLAKFALDMGDIQGAYGGDGPDGEPLDEDTWGGKIRAWLLERKRGYLSVWDRRQALLRHLESLSAPGEVV